MIKKKRIDLFAKFFRSSLFPKNRELMYKLEKPISAPVFVTNIEKYENL